MSTAELERVLALWRGDPEEGELLELHPLSVDEALAYKRAGNIPDENDRSLRLVLFVDEGGAASLEAKRARFEPDFLQAPTWRTRGSRAINVVPLKRAETTSTQPDAWWEDPEMAALEAEWSKGGTVSGLDVPAEYRSFVYKTVLSLRRAGIPVTAESVADSVSRWVTPELAEELRSALLQADPGPR